MYAPPPAIIAALRLAAGDYRWLLDRAYSESAALKLVGDRFQLAGEERMLLFRSVTTGREAAARKALLEASVRGRPLLIDGHNQVFTVMHYLEGKPVFLASDGLVRDTGGSHGHIAQTELFERALGLLARTVARERPGEVLALFDAPIPKSAGHAQSFRDALAALGVEAEARIALDADAPLKLAPASSLVATSDSAIADALAARPEGEKVGLYDAARATIEGLRAEPEEKAGASPWFDMARFLENADEITPEQLCGMDLPANQNPTI